MDSRDLESPLAEKHRQTIVNALRVAAEVYDGHAKAMHECEQSSLERQFKRQAAEARMLADDLEA